MHQTQVFFNLEMSSPIHTYKMYIYTHTSCTLCRILYTNYIYHAGEKCRKWNPIARWLFPFAKIRYRVA